jgi:magnesium chelatase family protein
MPSRILSAAIVGLDAQIIEVETDVSYGLRCFTMVGLPGKEVEEAKERIGSALKSAGFYSPYSKSQRVLINLAPADLKKQGALYDLPIALGYLLASGQMRFNTEGKIFVGELALDGKLRPIRGALSFSLKAKKYGFSEIILPKQNAPEAALVEDIKVVGAETLGEIADYLKGELDIPSFNLEREKIFEKTISAIDIGWIKGQDYAKRALEIAASGGHNLIMTGPPGTGKTLLAKSICSILPKLSFENSLEVTQIYSIAGLLPENDFLIRTPPFRSPHHTSSDSDNRLTPRQNSAQIEA